MSTSTSNGTASIADLEQAEGRCELINGEIVSMSPAGYEHGRVGNLIAFALTGFCQRSGGWDVITCETGFVWDERNVRCPDVAVVDRERARQAPARGFPAFVPNLAVEVVSPSDSWSDVKEKARQWLSHGVSLVWVADPRTRTVEVYAPDRPAIELSERDEIDGGAVLPGFRCAVADLFR